MAIAAWMMPLTVSALDYSNPANNNYVSEWGKLKLVGNQLSSESGARVQLRGWSTHGKNWQGGCFDDKGDFELMKAKGANVARIAMYLKEGGYEDIFHTHPGSQASSRGKQRTPLSSRVATGISWSTLRGLCSVGEL